MFYHPKSFTFKSLLTSQEVLYHGRGGMVGHVSTQYVNLETQKVGINWKLGSLETRKLGISSETRKL